MPINPHAEGPAATAWADQFGTEVRQRAQEKLEEGLHRQGLCTEMFDVALVVLLDTALQCGSVAMAELLEQHDRFKED